jgi:hypothetical protein
MTVRDNFSAATKRLLAGRVGHRCSNPGCEQSTSGPALDATKVVSVGEASHITAAAPGGMRYDKSLTPEERSSETNGIWLCDLCASLIDKDENRFTVEVLRKWKEGAVNRALKEITTRAPGGGRLIVIIDDDDDDRTFLGTLGLPAEDSLDAVVARIGEAAERDIAAFRRAKEWPAHTIALNLTLHEGDKRQELSVEQMADAIDVAEVANLVAAPGTGKSTTMVQLAGAILGAGRAVPALVPLGEWSALRENFFLFLTRRNAYGAFRPQHFMQLAYNGRLRLLLDGWNELDPDSRLAAMRHLKALRRDYPLLGIVIGTRRRQLPISGLTVEIESLSQDQQLELARALRGPDGEALVDQAWRTAGVRELIAIPLYLTALLGSTPGAAFPQTKEEVLRLFVTQHEQDPEKAEILRRELHGFHRNMLMGLAIEANRVANTVLSDTSARYVISNVEDGLVAQKQLTIAPQPDTVIESLVNGHLLIRVASGGDGVSFQHQQFQEWYASFEVERLMKRAATDAQARAALRGDILNWPAWEESILFACERLSRENPDGVRAVAAAIREALGIDPILAAEMIFRSAPEVWPLISAEVVAFAARWHTAGKADRAARFIMTTGRPEFAPQIWPLISTRDDQVYLSALRAPVRFRPKVLGDDTEARLAALPEETRRHVVAEIAANSGFDGMELAVRIARADPSPEVVVEILQALQFRRADRLVGEILRSASDAVWERVAQRGYPDVLADRDQNARLDESRRVLIAAQTDPLKTLNNLAAHPGDESAPARIAEMIASAGFQFRNDGGSIALRRAYEAYPDAVREGLLRRIAAQMELPYGAESFLRDGAAIDDGPIAASVLDMSIPERVAHVAATTVGPRTIGAAMDRMFVLDAQAQPNWTALAQADRAEHGRIRDAIASARSDSLVAAVLARANTNQPARIARLADFIAWNQRRDEEHGPMVPEQFRPGLSEALANWINTLLQSPQANRHEFADVINAVARLPEPRFVGGLEQMLERDLADWARAREEWARSPRRGALTPDQTHDHTIEYQRAFAAIGGAEVIDLMKRYLPNLPFGLRAANTLFDIWNREHPSSPARQFFGWPDYSRAKELHAQRRNAPETLSTSDFAEAIFDVVKSIGTAAADEKLQQHAAALASIGLGLPHGSKRAETDALMALPLPVAAKQRLLIAAAMAGETIPAEMIIAGLDELLRVGETESWRLRGDRGELMLWLELFAFADRPMSVLTVLDRLPAEYRYPRSLERLLSALSKSPHEEAVAVLEGLLRRDPRMIDEYDWLNALMKIGTEDSAKTLIAHICDGRLASARGLDSYHLSQYLAQLGVQFPAIKDELLQRYERMQGGRAKAILEGALGELADPETILTLIGGYAADGRAYDGGLAGAIREVALGRRPAEGWGPGAYQEFSVPLTKLRQRLFAIAVANDPRAVLAKRCLITIEKLRDEYGRIDDEPRHPDISSGIAWPLIR